MTAEQILACEYLNSEFPKFENKLSRILTIDNLISEAHSLNAIEAAIPEKLFTEIHIDKILNEGGSRVKQYYLGLSSGRNAILEEAKASGLNTKQINEAIEDFRNFIRHKLFEEAMELGVPTASTEGFDKALAGGEYAPPSGGSKWTVLGTLKKIWNALTEDGSVIGIIHLILDIIGLVGDFIFPGVGVVADIINGIIYAIRGKWILALISLIAAVIVGAGDGLKLFKPAAETAAPIFVQLTKKGGVEAASAIAGKVTNKGPVMRFLGLLASMVGTTFAKCSTLLSKFFSGIAKVLDWVPGLSRLTTPLFEGLGRIFTSFADKMKLFADNFKLMEKGAAKVAVESIDDAITSGSKFAVSADGKYVTFTTKAGKEVAYPAEKVAQAYIIKSGDKAAPYLFKNGPEWVKYHRALSNPEVAKSFGERFTAFFMTRFGPEAAARFKTRLPLFLGKQIYKLIFGSDWVDGASKWKKEEVQGHGNGAFNDFINRRIQQEKEATGADFIPSVMLDASDKEAFNKISEYQNHYAETMGKPSIMHVVYDKAEDSPDAKEFRQFFNQVSSGEIQRGDQNDIVQTGISSAIHNTGKPIKNESRTISSFSDFKKI